MLEELFPEIKLTTEERERWIKFHHEAYKEDIEISEKLLLDSPRWSVISAYYAMHDISKLYLGKIHNLKISGDKVHAKTLFFISKYVKLNSKKIIPLLEEAKKEYDAIASSNIWIISRLLSKGRDERTKTQYYNAAKTDRSKIEHLQTAQYFIDNFMKPYMKILEGML
ncbi:hypothetical protein COV93_00305 [Candidatus Woesearchaeota archaeon CG11_big_fil_rev_8_21_14_0_20_43_8]|nr:MAG: hypothetical protein COV93_00305 [Candidatus Woesearchaeota archaeon CG11_big_fil_rev_8_21_14_0_20_43_8]PIO05113.1 MAG: hypothetical protein COT47_06180 [Candidatus Woesearchaeota archaeon CG08_land_8_20_14_0_20_43_7]